MEFEMSVANDCLQFSSPNGETLCRSIEEATWWQVRDLSVKIEKSRVRVTGVSESYYIKQLVTRTVQHAVPNHRICNEVNVCRAG